ncbi:hypothetical protein ACWGK1_09525 [Streptomyces wedmorensis]
MTHLSMGGKDRGRTRARLLRSAGEPLDRLPHRAPEAAVGPRAGCDVPAAWVRSAAPTGDDRDTVQAHEWWRRGSPTVPKGFSAAVWSAYP